MPFVLQHKTTGYFCSGVPSDGEFKHSPNHEDAVTFASFDAAEHERRKFHEFAGAWMTITLEEPGR